MTKRRMYGEPHPLRRKLLDWIGYRLLKLARCCFWHTKSIRHCWICGAAPGMGPVWGGRMTCDHCYDRWRAYHHPAACPEMVVDWRGIGRVPESESARARKETA